MGNAKQSGLKQLGLKQPGLVIAPNWVGDAVMCLPALRALVAAREDLRWQVLARPPVAGVFAAAARAGPAPGWQLLEASGEPGPRQLWRLRRRLRGQPPAAAVIFPNSMYTALAAWASGAKIRIGYARDGRSPLLSTAIAVPRAGETPPHEAFYYLELLRRAGLIARLPDGVEPLRAALRPSAAAVARWQERLAAWPQAPGRSRVAIHAGASFGHAKRWLPGRFAATAAALAQDSHAVFFIGSAAEAPLAAELAAQAAAAAPAAGPVISLAGKTDLDGLLAVLSQCRLLIANDSGPMHLAAGVGTPVLAIFGSTNARETHPLAAVRDWRLIQAPGIACSPCKRRECPIDHRCMTRVQVAEVAAAARDLLARAGPGTGTPS